MSYRDYQILQGDTLRAIATVQYRDATRWREIAEWNNLRPPHIVDSYDEADRLPNTAIWGDTLRLRTPTAQALAPPDTDLFGRDVLLTHGRLLAEGGDLKLVEGVDNLVQAANHRIKTLTGELLYYPTYGCFVQLALGLKLEPVITLMGAAWVREALQREPRLASIDGLQAQAEGDRLAIHARVTAVGQNSPIDINLVTP